MKNNKITLEQIEGMLYDLDSEYRESLAHAMMDLNYVSDTPLRMSLGTEEQQEELSKVMKKSLDSKEVKEIISYMKKDMAGDFQYISFKPIAEHYLKIAEQMEKNSKSTQHQQKTNKCTLVEIYDKETDVVILQFVKNKKTPIENQAVNALNKFGFKLFIQGKVTPKETDLYWLASNKDYSNLHLTYREKEINKKDLMFDPKDYSYTSYNKKLSKKSKDHRVR